MTAATDAASRMLVLVPWLAERPGAHIDEVAELLDVGRETVLEDLSALNFCGLPGRLGGDLFDIDVLDDRVLVRMAPAFERPLRITPGEGLRLVLALDHVAAALGDELPGLDDALDRLRAAIGVPDGVRVEPDPAGEHLAELRAAIAARTQAQLTYRGRGDAAPRERVVDPWRLQRHRGAWYLHAHDHDAQDRRTFRLDRLHGLARRDQARTTDPPEELPPPVYVAGPDDTAVVIEVSAAGRWLLETLALDELDELDDGSAIARLTTDAPGWVASLVLAGRGEAEVVEPASLRAQVRERAQEALRLGVELRDE